MDSTAAVAGSARTDASPIAPVAGQSQCPQYAPSSGDIPGRDLPLVPFGQMGSGMVRYH